MSLKLFKGAYKVVLSSLGLVCATRSHHNIPFKCLSSPCHGFFNCYCLLKFAQSVNNYLKPFKNQRYRATLSSLEDKIQCLCHKIQSPFGLSEASRHPSAYQELYAGNFLTVFSWPRMARLKFSSKRTIWNLFYLEQQQVIGSFTRDT